MKLKASILLLSILISSVVFSQTYSFSKLVKKANVQTASGNQLRIISTTEGPYRFIFETPSDPQMKRLFTLLVPGQNNAPGLPWFGLLKEMGYAEKDGKLLKKYLYFDTENDARVLVMIADDYSLMVIFKNDETIWEFTK